MATFDQLTDEQRAIIELVLRSGRSYDTLADMLDATPSRVRELARDALTELSPTTASRVDPEWRGQLADYVLGQQSGPESTATQWHLRRSEPARVWAYSLLDSLDHLYGNGARPEVPAAGDGAAAAPPRRERERKRERERERRPLREQKPAAREREREREPATSAAPVSDEAQRVVRRRRLIGGGIALLVAAGIIVGIVALASGGGGGKKKSSASKSANTPVKVLGSVILNPQNGAKARGVAVIAQRGGQRQLIVQAALPASRQGEAYVVWLFNSPQDAVSVGAQVADKQGRFQGAGPLPANYQRYKNISVTRQKISAQATTYGGTLILSGALANLVTPQQVQQQQQQQGQGQTGTGTTPPGGTGTTPQGGTGTTP